MRDLYNFLYNTIGVWFITFMNLPPNAKIFPLIFLLILLIFAGIGLSLGMQLATLLGLLWLTDGQDKFKIWYEEVWPIWWQEILDFLNLIREWVIYIFNINWGNDPNLADK